MQVFAELHGHHAAEHEEHRVLMREPTAGPMWSLGANVGATWANDFPRQTNEDGQAGGDHASSRTGPDDAERLTGIYGSDT